MACKNISEALIEDVIEITWMFDDLVESGSIKSLDEIIEQECGHDGIKNTIKDIAIKFEEKYPFDTAWKDGKRDYVNMISAFAEVELIKKYRKA